MASFPLRSSAKRKHGHVGGTQLTFILNYSSDIGMVPADVPISYSYDTKPYDSHNPGSVF